MSSAAAFQELYAVCDEFDEWKRLRECSLSSVAIGRRPHETVLAHREKPCPHRTE